MIFLMAFVISDLASEEDKNLTRVASISSITWPVMVASLYFRPRIRPNCSAGIFLMVGALLHEHSRGPIPSSMGRRYRGIGRIWIILIVALMITRSSNHELVGVSTTIMVIMLAYDLLRQNPMVRGRKELMRDVDALNLNTRDQRTRHQTRSCIFTVESSKRRRME